MLLPRLEEERVAAAIAAKQREEEKRAAKKEREKQKKDQLKAEGKQLTDLSESYVRGCHCFVFRQVADARTEGCKGEG